MSEDRNYWSKGKAWHAYERVEAIQTICGRYVRRDGGAAFADRVPSDGHLCGNCARIIAARTDIEG